MKTPEPLSEGQIRITVRPMRKGSTPPPMRLTLGGEVATLSPDCPEAVFTPKEGERLLSVSTDVPTLPQRGWRRILSILLFILFLPLALLLMTVNFFADNGQGIRPYRFFEAYDPYRIRRAFTLPATGGVSYTLCYTASTYRKKEECYLPPALFIEGEAVTAADPTVTPAPSAMRAEFYLYHAPAYLLALSLSAALAVLAVSFFFRGPITLGVLAGAGAMLAVMLALLGFLCLTLIRTVKLYRRVLAGMEEKKDE